jgi:hypothetical protein
MHRLLWPFCALVFAACNGSDDGSYVAKGRLSGWTLGTGSSVVVETTSDHTYEITSAPIAADGSFDLGRLPVPPEGSLVEGQLSKAIEGCSQPAITPASFKSNTITFRLRDSAGQGRVTLFDGHPVSELYVMYSDRAVTIKGSADCPARFLDPRTITSYDLDLVAGYNAVEVHEESNDETLARRSLTSVALPYPLGLHLQN